ncbi:hypothetical protein GCM10028804_10090 [Larkinella terrae]
MFQLPVAGVNELAPFNTVWESYLAPAPKLSFTTTPFAEASPSLPTTTVYETTSFRAGLELLIFL